LSKNTGHVKINNITAMECLKMVMNIISHSFPLNTTMNHNEQYLFVNERDWAGVNDTYSTLMRVNDIFNSLMRVNDILICIVSRLNEK
jgi:hypothetical protein